MLIDLAVTEGYYDGRHTYAADHAARRAMGGITASEAKTMAQLPYTDPETVDPVMKAVFEQTVKRFQMPLNIISIMGNAPEIGSKMIQIYFDILQDGAVDWATKELAILKATKMGDCLYCVTRR